MRKGHPQVGTNVYISWIMIIRSMNAQNWKEMGVRMGVRWGMRGPKDG